METWKIIPLLVARTTGLPVELLDQIQFPQTLQRIRSIVNAETRIVVMQRYLLHTYFPQAVQQVHVEGPQELLKQLSHWRRCVGGRRCVEGWQTYTSLCSYEYLWEPFAQWNKELTVYKQQLVEGERIWDEELCMARIVLRHLMINTTIQEAIFLSNPDMYVALTRYLQAEFQEKRDRNSRKIERRFMMYLQRLCTKNETQSFFGPINYGRINTACDKNIFLQHSHAALRERQVFASHWMVERLAQVISSDKYIRPFLKPRRSSLCAFRGQQIIFPLSKKKESLDEQSTLLLQLADGTRTIQEMTSILGTHWEDIWSQCEYWRRAGALVTVILIPGTEAAPLLYLHAWVLQLPDDAPSKGHWLQVLEKSMSLIERFAVADMKQRPALLADLEAYLKGICGTEMRRGTGSMYSDRLPIFEECLGNFEQCELGGLLAQRIEQGAQALFRLSLIHGLLLAQRDQQRARALWQQLRGQPDDAIPFLVYLRALQKDVDVPKEKDALDDFIEQLHALVRMHNDGYHVCLQSSDLPAPPLPSDDAACLYSSFDFLIASPSMQALQQGDFQIVLGEIHPYPLTWVFPTAYFLTGEEIHYVEELKGALAAQRGGAVAAQIVYTRKNKIFPYPLPGQNIELRPRNPGCQAIPAAELEVREVNGQLRLATADRYYRLYAPLTQRNATIDPIAPFAFPSICPPLIDLGEHTPRIEIDGIVYQREHWKVSGNTFNQSRVQGFALLLEAWRWREHYKLPMRMFVRPNKEPKPIYIDLSNPLLVEVLDMLAQQNDTLMLTEMVPDIHQLWLEQADGHYTCEFRAVVIGDT